MGKATVGRKAVSLLAALSLACGLTPVAAWADEASEPADASAAAALELEAGTYVEHEAIAYVMDGAEVASPLSRAADVLAGAEDLMAVDAGAAATALGDEEGLADKATNASGSSRARSVDRSGGSMPAGRLVLLHDDAKSAEQLITDLEADPRVLFAEPNYVAEPADESAESASGDERAIEGEGFEAEQPEVIPEDGSAADRPVAVIENAEDAEQLAAESGAEGDPGTDADVDQPDDADQPVVLGEDEDEPAGDLTDFQWGMDNDGRFAGVSPDEALDMDFGAWDDVAAAQSLEPVVVAIIDTGVDASNPDLAPVMWDGGNDPALIALGGDEHGYSALAGRSSTDITAEDVAEGNYHGTHVAGIVAASWNGEGTSGVAPNARIMSLRNDDTLAGVLKCFAYVEAAAKAGVNVRVANLSWGLGVSASHAIDLAVAQAGEAGVVSVAASGNSTSDMDAVSSTAASLRDNPYAVVVDAYDESGALSDFSSYGRQTTDIVAPGSAILSTYPTVTPNYLGEEDASAALYESFDGETRVSEGVQVNGSAAVGGEPIISFRPTGSGSSGEIVSGGQRFEGDSSLAFDCDPSTAGGIQMAMSEPVDLSGLAEKPRYLSLRYSCALDDPSLLGVANVQILVKTANGDPVQVEPQGAFGMGGTTWSGFYVELPENADWDAFQLALVYTTLSETWVGQSFSANPAPGTVYIDSIGLGSDKVPYAYLQGTSMAAPAVAGEACVLAGAYPDEGAAQLAARVLGSAQPAEAFAEICSTGGYASVDGATDPAPVPVSASLADDGLLKVRAFFASDNVQVTVGGAAAKITGSVSQEDGSELFSVALPEGFAGGSTEVRLTDLATGKSGRLFADLGPVVRATYYERTGLPVPDEIKSWGTWQLVGFAGDIYALPQSNSLEQDSDYDCLMRYDPQTGTWDSVALPTSLGNVVSVSGATYRGRLVLQVTCGATDEEGAYYWQTSYWWLDNAASWEELPVNMPEGRWIGMSSMGSDGDNLYLFGGRGVFGASAGQEDAEAADSNLILRIDVDTGAVELAGGMQRGRVHPAVAYRDGAFLVSGGLAEYVQDGFAMGVERVTPLQEDMGSLSAGMLVGSYVDMSSVVTETGQLAFSPVSAEGGFMLVGPQSDAGDADTYTLANADGAQPAAYGKRAASQRLLYAGAVAYDGALYVLGSVSSEPYWVFGATPVRTDPQPGDYVAPEPEPQPEPEPEPQPQPEPSPDTDSGSDLGQGGEPAGEPSGEEAGASLKKLATTGDPLIAVGVCTVVAALASGAVAAAALRRSRHSS